MRQDMNKLVTVRTMDAYFGAKPSYRVTRLPRDLESLPSRQSMRSSVPHDSQPRALRINPVMRWLRAQVNRPWSAVYGELRHHFDHRNLTERVVLDRVLALVERDVFFDEENQPYVVGHINAYAVEGLYVDPNTGQLCFKEKAQWRRRQNQALKVAALTRDYVPVSKTRQLRLLAGLWFWVELSPITAPRYCTPAPLYLRNGEEVAQSPRLDEASVCRDVLTGKEFFRVPLSAYETRDLFESYGLRTHYASRKWQANSADIRRHVKAL